MDTLRGLRIALNSWAAVPKHKVIGRSSVTGARQHKAMDGAGVGLGQGEAKLAPHFDGDGIVLWTFLTGSSPSSHMASEKPASRATVRPCLNRR